MPNSIPNEIKQLTYEQLYNLMVEALELKSYSNHEMYNCGLYKLISKIEENGTHVTMTELVDEIALELDRRFYNN